MKRGRFYSLAFLFVIGIAQIGLCQPPVYNPSLNIITSTSDIKKNGYVKYTTTNASSGDARFTLFGDGYFDMLNNFDHQFPEDSLGFETATYFNKKYKKRKPTKRTKLTGQTGSGSGSGNRKIFMPTATNIRVATSWAVTKEVENYFMLIFENTGTAVDSGCVMFYFNDKQLNLNYTDVLEYGWVNGKTLSGYSGSTTYNQELKFNFKNLLPGEQRVVYIPMTSKLAVGKKIDFGSKYDSGCSGKGGKGINGSAAFTMGSPHDPNTKYADRSCIIPYQYNQQNINYTITFQNEGDAPAVNVVVIDELDLNQLDLRSLRLIDSEYSCTYTINGNVLEIAFNNINLPGLKQRGAKTYSYSDTESWVTFSICARDYRPVGEILNFAEIYFDTQPPILTNTSSIVIDDHCTLSNLCGYAFKSTSTSQINEAEIIISPNPAENMIFLDGMNNEKVTVNVFNMRGELIFSKSEMDQNNNAIDLNGLNNGMYFINIKNENINITKKLMKL